MSDKYKNLIAAIISDDKIEADRLFSQAIREKANNVLDIKRVAITADIYEKQKVS